MIHLWFPFGGTRLEKDPVRSFKVGVVVVGVGSLSLSLRLCVRRVLTRQGNEKAPTGNQGHPKHTRVADAEVTQVGEVGGFLTLPCWHSSIRGCHMQEGIPYFLVELSSHESTRLINVRPTWTFVGLKVKSLVSAHQV